MATLYLRKNRWWVAWYVGKDRFAKSTGYFAHEREEAEAAKVNLERELAQRIALTMAPPEKAKRTFGGYRKQWVENRRAQGKACVQADESRLRHVRELDTLLMTEVKPRHIRAVVLRLRREGKLAPRSIRNVFGVLHRLFQDAFIDELVAANPCVLPEGDLPAKVDADPTWRAGAVFTRAEVERILWEPSIPEARRIYYAVVFLAGLRHGEAAALRWHAYLPDMEPLGQLVVATSFNTARNLVKGVKAEGQTRLIPVHPALAPLLSAWKLGGWARVFGRPPAADDLIVPSTAAASFGKHMRNRDALYSFHRDLDALGLRRRRVHDGRRTFISLCRADGAITETLRAVTHGRSGDIMDVYTTHVWAALCAEVAKLNIRAANAATFSLHCLQLK